MFDYIKLNEDIEKSLSKEIDCVQKEYIEENPRDDICYVLPMVEVAFKTSIIDKGVQMPNQIPLTVIKAANNTILSILHECKQLIKATVIGDTIIATFCGKGSQLNTLEISDTIFYINTTTELFNKILNKKLYPNIFVSIALDYNVGTIMNAKTGNEIMITGTPGRTIDLSRLPLSYSYKNIIFTRKYYEIYSAQFKNVIGDSQIFSWIEMHDDPKFGVFYDCNITIKNYQEWIANKK